VTNHYRNFKARNTVLICYNTEKMFEWEVHFVGLASGKIKMKNECHKNEKRVNNKTWPKYY